MPSETTTSSAGVPDRGVIRIRFTSPPTRTGARSGSPSIGGAPCRRTVPAGGRCRARRPRPFLPLNCIAEPREITRSWLMFGELRRQLVGHSLGEVVLARVARVVVERKHGEGSNGPGLAFPAGRAADRSAPARTARYAATPSTTTSPGDPGSSPATSGGARERGRLAGSGDGARWQPAGPLRPRTGRKSADGRGQRRLRAQLPRSSLTDVAGGLVAISRGSFSTRQRRTMRTSSGGRSAASSPSGDGVSRRIAAVIFGRRRALERPPARRPSRRARRRARRYRCARSTARRAPARATCRRRCR